MTLLVLLAATQCHAGIGSWLRNEVAPILAGKKPLKIDPTRVSIVHKGKPILKYEGDSLYVKAGGVTFQTSKLRQRVAEAGAIFSGDVAVLSKVAAEQLDKELKKAQQAGEISVSEQPPAAPEEAEKIETAGQPATPPASTPASACAGKDVVLHNQTPVAIRYAMNGSAFELSSGEGYRHCAGNGEFFLQFDEDIGEGFKVARYALTGKVYRLFVVPASSTIQIAKNQ